MSRSCLALLLSLLGLTALSAAEPKGGPADLIIHHAHVLLVDAKFTSAEAIAVKDGKVLAVGEDEAILKLAGPKTKVIDGHNRTVMPGLCDSHTHAVGAATSEIKAPLPALKSLKDVFAYLKEKVANTPEGEWITLQYAFPTRLEDARFPTKAELDAVAPKHPVLYHAGPAGLTNSLGLKVSGITKETPSPKNGMIVKDPTTGEPTGMLRNAYGVLKGMKSEGGSVSAEAKREAVKKLFRLYNEQGITSIGERSNSRGDLDMYHSMKEKGELTLRINLARSFSPGGTREEVIRRLEELPGKDNKGGPTGVGDEWVRVGPIKIFLDGGMLNGSAYMRQPWPKGPTYQITEEDYRGLLFIQQEQLRTVVEEAAKRKWQVTAHSAGEGAMDELLDAYEFVNRQVSIKDLRMCITHANFPSQRNLERCKALNVVADVQPAWFWKDGTTLLNVLGKERVRWFQPYKSWMEYTTIGGGSDHMIKLDAIEATNPWHPWLGMWVTLNRVTEKGSLIQPDERLTREQAVRLYTCNNAYILHAEKERGTLEPGKMADLIVLDQDLMTCPVKNVRDMKVLYTIVGGKIVYERKQAE